MPQSWLAVAEVAGDLGEASRKPAEELEGWHHPAIQGASGPGLQAMLPQHIKVFKSQRSLKREIKDHRNY